jgi:hypothetical protein
MTAVSGTGALSRGSAKTTFRGKTMTSRVDLGERQFLAQLVALPAVSRDVDPACWRSAKERDVASNSCGRRGAKWRASR